MPLEHTEVWDLERKGRMIILFLVYQLNKQVSCVEMCYDLRSVLRIRPGGVSQEQKQESPKAGPISRILVSDNVLVRKEGPG